MLLSDLRDAVRSVLHHRTFAVVAILTLAIGIGANTALFSVVHAVLLRPLPYEEPGSLAWVATAVPALRAEIAGGADYLDWRDQARSLASIAAWDEAPNLVLTGLAEPERVTGARVSASLLPTLGARPARGRGFSQTEEKLNATPVAMVSDRLWRRLYGPEAVPAGQLLRVDGDAYEIVGVLAPDFVFPQGPDVDVLLPLRLDEARERSRQLMSILHVIARVRPGITTEQARAELTAIRDRAEEAAAARRPGPRATDATMDGPEATPGVEPFGRSGPAGGPAPGGLPGDTFDVAVAPPPPSHRSAPGEPSGDVTMVPPPAGAPGPNVVAPRPDAQGAAPPPDRQVEAPVPPPGAASPAPGPTVRPGAGRIRIERDGPGGPAAAGAGRPHTDVVVRPLHEQLVGDVKPALLLLTVTVGLVLLVACVNVANLVLARTTGRIRELAVRTALGASRWRIIRQVLTESVLVSLLGGVAALLVATWAIRVLMAAIPPEISRGWLGHVRIGLDPTALAFTFVVAAVTGALAGIGPALAASRVDVHGSLKDAAPATSPSPGRRRFRTTLVVGEIAVAVVLLAGAGLLVRSFARLLAVDPGFRPDRVVTMALDVGRGPDEASRQRSAAFFAALAERTGALAGVDAVAYGDTIPLREYTTLLIGLEPEGRERASDGPPPEVAITVVSPDYFRTFGMKLLQGRTFTAADRAGAAEVGIVNESTARQLWGTVSPVGRRIRIGPGHPDWITIVGVVADVKHDGPSSAARCAMYRPFDQAPMPMGFLAVRTAGEPAAMIQAVRHEVHALDPSLVVYDVATMDQRIASAIVGRRFSMLLVGAVAAIALLLAAVGLYGVLSSAVAERTREIGIRMAMGARAADVLRLIGRQTAVTVGIGLALGLAGALATGPLLASALFQVSSRDAVTLVTVPLLLGGVALVAAWLPARRATRVDPLTALREE